jgi:NADPH-dependent glutamate synthase beta subunit-like oxidoreductase
MLLRRVASSLRNFGAASFASSVGAGLAAAAPSNGPLRVCVVGAGPAGLYTAKYLLREEPGATVDILEALPTPYGQCTAVW